MIRFRFSFSRLASVMITAAVLLLAARPAGAQEVPATAMPVPGDRGASDTTIVQPNRFITDTNKSNPRVPAAWIPSTSTTVNGLPIGAFIVMPPQVVEHVRAIYAHGRALGRNPHAFAKIGDSTIEYPYFFINFDNGKYKLGVYADLQATIAYYAGYFARRSAALRVGQHAWTVMSPGWASDPRCSLNEGPVQCELRLINPSVALIRLGANDASYLTLFEKNFRLLVEYLIDQGVIPILSTKADRQAGMIDVNNLMRRLAAEYRVPLWDLDRLMQNMPNRGLWIDGVHLSAFFPMDYTDTVAYQRGHAVQNLTGLMALDLVRRTVITLGR